MLVTAPVSLGSQAAFQSAIEGYWALCSGQSALCSSDEAGLEIASDGHWYKLYADDSGQLWRGLGWERRGSWQVIDTSAQNGTETYQLNLMIDGSGTVFGVPRLSGELGQRRMNFASACDQNGTLQGDYVQLPAP
jgi:hypothetical protein